MSEFQVGDRFIVPNRKQREFHYHEAHKYIGEEGVVLGLAGPGLAKEGRKDILKIRWDNPKNRRYGSNGIDSWWATDMELVEPLSDEAVNEAIESIRVSVTRATRPA